MHVLLSHSVCVCSIKLSHGVKQQQDVYVPIESWDQPGHSHREYYVSVFRYQVYQARLWERLLTSRSFPSDSTCILNAEPGELDIKRREPGILFISLPIVEYSSN